MIFEKKYLFLSFILVFIAHIFSFNLFSINFNIPISYHGGDNLMHYYYIKSFIENLTINHNPNLSAPAELFMYDFPIVGEEIHFVIYWLISLFNKNIFFILNFYFFLKFYLIAYFSYLAFRKTNISPATSSCLSFLYAFSPIIFYRYFGHFFLGIYFSIPIFLIILFNIYFQENKNLKNFLKENIVYLILLSISGIYYSYFSILLFFSVFLYAVFDKNEVKLIYKKTVVSILIIISVIIINAIPHLYYKFESGENLTGSILRNIHFAERYGLKLISLLMPVENHYLDSFSNLKKNWNVSYENYENNYNPIGFIGSIGFLFLLIWPILKKNSLFAETKNDIKIFNTKNVQAINLLCFLTLFILLLTSFGSLSTFISYFFSSIRVYSRISIFIAFFSLISVGFILDGLMRKYNLRGFVASLIFLPIIFFGFFDQIGKRSGIQNLNTDFKSDRNFIKNIENILPLGSMVFQLPVLPFPEHLPLHNMLDYDHLRGYIHSKNLKWSYPAIKGRNSLDWQMYIAETPLINELFLINVHEWKKHQHIPVKKMINQLMSYGFSGIYIDSFAFPDRKKFKSLINTLKNNLEKKPLISQNKRLYFFQLPKNSFIITVGKDHYPKKLKILDQIDENTKFPKFINKSEVLKAYKLGVKNIDILYSSKVFFDKYIYIEKKKRPASSYDIYKMYNENFFGIYKNENIK